jgi:hemerythrin-like metal-binding protein
MNSTWKPEYENGIAEMDAQHRQLAEKLDLLEDALGQPRSRQDIALLLEGLISASEAHFRDEEALMSRHHCADFDQHQKEHLDLIQRSLAFKATFDSGASDLTVAVIRFLRGWLLNHIVGSDRKSSRLIRSNPAA